MSQLEAVKVEISVILGRSTLPMHQLLKMGRGAVIPLDAGESDEVWILANNHPVARGNISIQSERVAVEITGPADVHGLLRGGLTALTYGLGSINSHSLKVLDLTTLKASHSGVPLVSPAARPDAVMAELVDALP